MAIPPQFESLNTALTCLDIVVTAGQRVDDVWELTVQRGGVTCQAQFTHTEQLISDEKLLEIAADISFRLHLIEVTHKLRDLVCSIPKPIV